MPILALRSSTQSLKSTGKGVFRDGTDKHTGDSHKSRHKDWIGREGQLSEEEKNYKVVELVGGECVISGVTRLVLAVATHVSTPSQQRGKFDGWLKCIFVSRLETQQWVLPGTGGMTHWLNTSPGTDSLAKHIARYRQLEQNRQPFTIGQKVPTTDC